jgi:hypothetical protein
LSNMVYHKIHELLPVRSITECAKQELNMLYQKE